MMTKLRTVFVFAKLQTRRFFRDPLAIFFTIAFPLIFLFVFGGIFGNNSGTSFKVALVNQSKSQTAAKFTTDFHKNNLLKVDDNVKSLDSAREKLARGELDATIILPDNFGQIDQKSHLPTGQAKVYYTQNNQQAAQALTSVLGAVFQEVNQQITKSPTLFSVDSEQLNVKSLSQFDYTFAGLLGFSIIGMGIFGPVNIFPELKKQGILRRYSTTPLKVWQYFLSNVIAQSTVGLLAIAVQFAVAISIFKLKVVGNYLELILFIVLSIVMILGIGLAIGGWARNERQAAPLSNIVVFPMMFLSGTFFPRFLMPEWLQQVSSFFPLTPAIDGIRLIATEGVHLVDIGSQLGLIVAWTIVIYIIAFRVFRWE
jgi:ABC-2 type transport system permease protein